MFTDRREANPDGLTKASIFNGSFFYFTPLPSYLLIFIPQITGLTFMYKEYLSRHKYKLLFVFFLLLLIGVKISLLLTYSFNYTGTDDLIYWQGARDYLNGEFHEPYFYGQAYNFMLDSLIALPLLACNIPYSIALPISSTFIGLFPFLFFAWILFRSKAYIPAYLFILIPITLPIGYDILTSISRGFTSGLFFASFTVFCLLDPNKRKSFVVYGLAASFGFVMNPNSILLTIPIGVYLLMMNYKEIRFYIFSLASAIPAFIIYYFAQKFYLVHPEYQSHFMWELNFKLSSMFDAFNHLDDFFAYLMPIYWKGKWLVIVFLLFLGFIIVRRNKKQGIVILISSLLIVLVLGINKVHDDLDTVFLSSSRMFLAIPLLIGIALFWLKDMFQKAESKWLILLVIIGFGVGTYKMLFVESNSEQHISETNFGAIAIADLEDLACECAEIGNAADTNNVELTVFISNSEMNVASMQLYNYGCSFYQSSLEASILNIYERRTWVFEKEAHAVHKTILIYGHYIDKIENNNSKIEYSILQEKPNLILIKNNTKTLPELATILDFGFTKHNYKINK